MDIALFSAIATVFFEKGFPVLVKAIMDCIEIYGRNPDEITAQDIIELAGKIKTPKEILAERK